VSVVAAFLDLHPASSREKAHNRDPSHWFETLLILLGDLCVVSELGSALMRSPM
jgi:hypothetical protein